MKKNSANNSKKFFSTQANNREKTSKQDNAGNVINLAELEPTQGFALNGIEETGFISFGSVSNAGDVNGDGFADIILSHPGAEVNSQRGAGEIYIIFGDRTISQGNLQVTN